MPDDEGRWRAQPNEAFNAGLGGFSSELFQYDAGNNGCATGVLWIVGIAFLVLGVVGPSVILLCLGGLLIAIAAPLSYRSLRARSKRRKRRA